MTIALWALGLSILAILLLWTGRTRYELVKYEETGGLYRKQITMRFRVTNWGRFVRFEEYTGSGSTVWYKLPDHRRAGTYMEAFLSDVDARQTYYANLQ